MKALSHSNRLTLSMEELGERTLPSVTFGGAGVTNVTAGGELVINTGVSIGVFGSLASPPTTIDSIALQPAIPLFDGVSQLANGLAATAVSLSPSTSGHVRVWTTHNSVGIRLSTGVQPGRFATEMASVLRGLGRSGVLNVDSHSQQLVQMVIKDLNHDEARFESARTATLQRNSARDVRIQNLANELQRLTMLTGLTLVPADHAERTAQISNLRSQATTRSQQATSWRDVETRSNAEAVQARSRNFGTTFLSHRLVAEVASRNAALADAESAALMEQAQVAMIQLLKLQIGLAGGPVLDQPIDQIGGTPSAFTTIFPTTPASTPNSSNPLPDTSPLEKLSKAIRNLPKKPFYQQQQNLITQSFPIQQTAWGARNAVANHFSTQSLDEAFKGVDSILAWTDRGVKFFAAAAKFFVVRDTYDALKEMHDAYQRRDKSGYIHAFDKLTRIGTVAVSDKVGGGMGSAVAIMLVDNPASAAATSWSTSVAIATGYGIGSWTGSQGGGLMYDLIGSPAVRLFAGHLYDQLTQTPTQS